MATQNNASLTIRMNSDVKRKAQTLFSELGLDMSTAINIFLRQAVREQRIPFEISAEIPNHTTRAAMDAAERGEDLYGPFDSVSDLMEALNA